MYLGVELLGHMVVLYLTFWETTKLFPTAAAPFCISNSNPWGLQFLDLLTNMLVFFSFFFLANSHPGRCEAVFHCCNLFLTKNYKQFNGGKTAFSTTSTGTMGHPYAKKMNLYLNLALNTNLNKAFREQTNTSSRSRAKHRLLRLDTKSMTHKRKN